MRIRLCLGKRVKTPKIRVKSRCTHPFTPGFRGFHWFSPLLAILIWIPLCLQSVLFGVFSEISGFTNVTTREITGFTGEILRFP